MVGHGEPFACGVPRHQSGQDGSRFDGAKNRRRRTRDFVQHGVGRREATARRRVERIVEHHGRCRDETALPLVRKRKPLACGVPGGESAIDYASPEEVLHRGRCAGILVEVRAVERDAGVARRVGCVVEGNVRRFCVVLDSLVPDGQPFACRIPPRKAAPKDAGPKIIDRIGLRRRLSVEVRPSDRDAHVRPRVGRVVGRKGEGVDLRGGVRRQRLGFRLAWRNGRDGKFGRRSVDTRIRHGRPLIGRQVVILLGIFFPLFARKRSGGVRPVGTLVHGILVIAGAFPIAVFGPFGVPTRNVVGGSPLVVRPIPIGKGASGLADLARRLACRRAAMPFTLGQGNGGHHRRTQEKAQEQGQHLSPCRLPVSLHVALLLLRLRTVAEMVPHVASPPIRRRGKKQKA